MTIASQIMGLWILSLCAALLAGILLDRGWTGK